jgi:release factor glutamine methyltransferase
VRYTKEKKGFIYKGLSIELHPEVYDPAEDTFLLLESINVSKNDAVFEIGTGCGIIAIECARIGADVICSDINKNAVDLAKHNYKKNKNKIKGGFEVRHGDLFNVLRMDENFDIIIFNPPYVPTKKDKRIQGYKWLDLATNGGKDGLQKTKSFIEGLQDHLIKSGRGYFIFSTLSDRKKLDYVLEKNGFEFKIKKSQRFLEETIEVYEIKKKIMKE